MPTTKNIVKVQSGNATNFFNYFQQIISNRKLFINVNVTITEYEYNMLFEIIPNF